MPFSSADNIQRWIANAILAVDVPLFIYVAYLLRNQAETLTGLGGFSNGTSLCLPVLSWGVGLGEWRSARQSLNFPLLSAVVLLLMISHSTLLTIAAFALLAVGFVLDRWLGKNDRPR